MKEYESPKAFKLDETDSIYGQQLDCDVGSGAGSCGSGQGAIGACAHPGNSAGTQCTGDGNSPEQQCNAQGIGK